MDSQQTGNVAPSTNASGKNSYASGVPGGDVEEPVMAHLFELRDRLAIVLIWLVVGIIISFPFSARGGMLLLWKEFIGPGMIMSAYSPLEWTLARLKLCLIFALAISIPLFFYELYRFAAKGLYPNERRFFIKVIPASFLLFMLGGTAIGYFLVLPVMFRYILFYSGDMATAQLSVQNTVSAVTTILAGFGGVVFQLPPYLWSLR